MRPSVAHQGFVRIPDNKDVSALRPHFRAMRPLTFAFVPQLCSEFSTSNPRCSVSPTQIAWRPFPLPKDSEKVNFVQGLKTVAGQGSPESASGLAIHMYLANTSMDKEAFINNDGDMCVERAASAS